MSIASETENRLRELCEAYANDLERGKLVFHSEDEEEVQEAYDIKYTVDCSKQYYGCRIMIVGVVRPFTWIPLRIKFKAIGVLMNGLQTSVMIVAKLLMIIGERCTNA